VTRERAPERPPGATPLGETAARAADPAAPDTVDEGRGRTLLGKVSPFVGREEELGLIREAVRAALEQRAPRALLVTGEAGIGKTRLCQEALRALQAGGAAPQIWVGRGEPVSAGSPFRVIGSAIRRAAGVSPGDATGIPQRKLRALAGRRKGGGEGAQTAEFLGEIAGVPFEETSSPRLAAARHSAGLMGDQMVRAWVDFLRAECAGQPVVLVLEDLHWGDRASLHLIEAALREEGLPLVVLAVGRAELHARFPDLFGAPRPLEIRLGELPRKSAEWLVRAALGKLATPQLSAAIVARASGNAFFLEELVRGAALGRAHELPASMLAVLRERLDALAPQERHVLCAASVFGPSFDGPGVRALVGDEVEVSAALASLEEGELIYRREKGRGDEAFAFHQAAMREAAYALLPEADRAFGHRLAASYLIEAGEGDARLLAEHFERGGEPERALGCYYRAAIHALEGSDSEGALACAERALACGAAGQIRGELYVASAEAHRWRDRNAEGQRHAALALDALRPGTSAWCAALSELAACTLRLGDPARLEALAAQLGEVVSAARSPVPAQIIACARVAAPLFLSGRHDAARALLRHIDAAGPSVASAPMVRARIFETLAIGAFCESDPGAAITHSAEAVRSFAEVGDLRAQAVLESNTGVALASIGAYAEAEAALRRALEAGERLGLPQITCAARQNLGHVLVELGQVEAGTALLHRAVRDAIVQQNLRLEVGARTYLALAARRAGQLGVAEAEADAAAKSAGDGSSQRVYALGALAAILLDQGRHDEAARVAAQAMDGLDALGGGLEEGEPLVRLAAIELMLVTGRRAEAEAALRRARERLQLRALALRDEALRRSFLGAVPDHRRLLALAADLLPT
jgi:tetratricopeptide (TPR) repeat protein